MPRWQCIAIGQGLAQALGKLSKLGVKQVDRLLSNQVNRCVGVLWLLDSVF